jgi:hypothetical protein
MQRSRVRVESLIHRMEKFIGSSGTLVLVTAWLGLTLHYYGHAHS